MECFESGFSTGVGAKHDVSGACNTVDVTYLASTTLSSGMPEPACTSTSRIHANHDGDGVDNLVPQPARLKNGS